MVFILTIFYPGMFMLRIYVKADLHGTTLSHTTSLRQAYDMNCFA